MQALKKIIILICIVAPGYVFATESLAEIVAMSRKNHIQCPPIHALKLNPKTKMWTADGGWKTYSQSFGSHIGGFLGAQWNGVSLGQIICIYRATDEFTFPIKLFYSKQVVDPETGKWEHSKKNVYNCPSTRKNCTFSPLLSPKDASPLEIAKELKNKPSNTLPEQNL